MSLCLCLFHIASLKIIPSPKLATNGITEVTFRLKVLEWGREEHICVERRYLRTPLFLILKEYQSGFLRWEMCTANASTQSVFVTGWAGFGNGRDD